MKNNSKTVSHLKSLGPCPASHNEESIRSLEKQIASLQEQLSIADSQVRTLKTQIQARYHNEIRRINELYSLYKNQKRLKKEKRTEQKKRGKNYKEPIGLKTGAPEKPAISTSTQTSSHELKKLYREAVLQVHPDKYVNHSDQVSKRSLELTIHLIDLYQSGNLNKLKQIHHHIMSGNAMAVSNDTAATATAPDPAAMKEYLLNRISTLTDKLTEVKSSCFYNVLSTCDNPAEFIDNMDAQFHIRIKQLERRTRS